MKRILLFALSLLSVVACSKFDDSEIWSELKEHEDRIVKLETLCNQMNTNITSLQTIIIALQNNDYVTNIAPIKEGSKEIGYTITFAKSGSITIYHGKDGENGKDGQNGTNGTDGKDGQDGKDGKDGYTPKIGVKQHTDGRYYWTLDGNWLLDDNGNMIPTTGEDGKNGQDGEDGKDGTNGTDGTDGKDGVDGKDGQDGITPKLKIEDGYWYLSYDNGATWQKLGKATGNNGLDGTNGADGEDGDSIIDSITQDDENVYFNLSDGQVITLTKSTEKIIIFSDINTKLICLEHWDTNGDCEISQSEAANVKSLNDAFRNSEIIIFNELKYFTGLQQIEDYSFENCSQLKYIRFPEQVSKIGSYAFSGCSELRNMNIPEHIQELGSFVFFKSGLKSVAISSNIKNLSVGVFKDCIYLTSVTFSNTSSLEVIDGKASVQSAPSGYECEGSDGAFSGCTSLVEIRLPASLTTIREGAFWGCTSLKSININELNNLTTIEGGSYHATYSNTSEQSYCGAFNRCTSLETIYLPSSITSLGCGIFADCNSSLEIYMSSNTPCKIETATFGKKQSYQPSWTSQTYYSIYVPDNALATYKAAANWKSRTLIGY